MSLIGSISLTNAANVLATGTDLAKATTLAQLAEVRESGVVAFGQTQITLRRRTPVGNLHSVLHEGYNLPPVRFSESEAFVPHTQDDSMAYGTTLKSGAYGVVADGVSLSRFSSFASGLAVHKASQMLKIGDLAPWYIADQIKRTITGACTTLALFELSADLFLRSALIGDSALVVLRPCTSAWTVLHAVTGKPLHYVGSDSCDIDLLDAQLEEGDMVLLFTDGAFAAFDLSKPYGLQAGKLVDLFGSCTFAGLAFNKMKYRSLGIMEMLGLGDNLSIIGLTVKK